LILCMRAETGSEKDLDSQTKVAETKFDGTRVLIQKIGNHVLLQNKDGIIYTTRLPEVVEAARQLKSDFILDAEAVYLDPNTGEESFTGSQRRCATQFPDPWLRQQFPITMEVFDILMLHGYDLTGQQYWKRKGLLKDLLNGSTGTLRYVPYTKDCIAAWNYVRSRGKEGLMLKEFDSRYEQCFPKRSWNWLKIKNWRHEVVDIVGYTPGKNSRAYFFGSLVLAKDGKYVGCAGSGLNDWELRRLRDIFKSSPVTAKPFDIGQPFTAVKTGLRVEVKFYKITQAGVMRFPVFCRLVE